MNRIRKKIFINLGFIILLIFFISCLEEPEDFIPDGMGDPQNPKNDIPPSPIITQAIVTEQSVTIKWTEVGDGETGYYKIFSKGTAGELYELAMTENTEYTISGLKTGLKYNFMVIYINNLGVESNAPLWFQAVPGHYSITINKNAPVTKNTRVEILSTGPDMNVVGYKLSENEDKLKSMEWQGGGTSTFFNLNNSEGMRKVFCKILNASGFETSTLVDSIYLDQSAIIDSVLFEVVGNSNSDTVYTGDFVHFFIFTKDTLWMGESLIELDTTNNFAVKCYDNGAHGDRFSGDGIYEAVIEIQHGLNYPNGIRLLGHFTDYAGNEANPTRSKRKIYILEK